MKVGAGLHVDSPPGRHRAAARSATMESGSVTIRCASRGIGEACERWLARRRSEGQVGHEMAVHEVEVEEICSSAAHISSPPRRAGKVGRKQRRCDADLQSAGPYGDDVRSRQWRPGGWVLTEYEPGGRARIWHLVHMAEAQVIAAAETAYHANRPRHQRRHDPQIAWGVVLTSRSTSAPGAPRIADRRLGGEYDQRRRPGLEPAARRRAAGRPARAPVGRSAGIPREHPGSLPARRRCSSAR